MENVAYTISFVAIIAVVALFGYVAYNGTQIRLGKAKFLKKWRNLINLNKKAGKIKK